jgi:hypothetical protein
MLNFKVKNPINNFTETFKKIIDQQCTLYKCINDIFRDYRKSHVLAPLLSIRQHDVPLIHLVNLM